MACWAWTLMAFGVGIVAGVALVSLFFMMMARDA